MTHQVEDGFKVVESDCLNIDNGLEKSDRVKNVQVVNRGDVDDTDWEKEYESEELDSDDPDVSGDEKAHVYGVFKVSQLTKDYEFKVGMNFKSL